MHRLIQSGLMFGGLVPVDSPALVERYNRALDHLTGKRTDLTEFHIDLSGFSPEVGDALGDMDYLNPGGCNRQFILLSTRQKHAPLLEMRFSNTRDILRDFIAANEEQLFALTARDAVAGELQNSVWSVDAPERLLDIRTVTVEADTTTGTVAEAEKLNVLIERFRTEEDAWWDDVLVAQMIDLARQTGDVTRAPVTFQNATFKADDFWTSHHGGLYVFRSVAEPAVLARTIEQSHLDKLEVIPLDKPNQIATFLQLNGLTQPIVEGRGSDAAAILREKMEILAIDALGQAGHLPDRVDMRALRRVMRAESATLPQAFHGLASILAWAEGQGDWPHIDSHHPAYFHTLRAAPGPLRDKVNMLLAELAPQDFRQLYICHKPLFFDRYTQMSGAWREWVVDRLKSGYGQDSEETWERLYARDVPKPMPKVGRPGSPVERMKGPWG